MHAANGISLNAGLYRERFNVVSGAMVALQALKWASVTDHRRFLDHVKEEAFIHDPFAQGLRIEPSDYNPNIIEQRFARYYGPNTVAKHREALLREPLTDQYGEQKPATTGAYEVFANSSKGLVMWGFAWLMTCVAKNEEYLSGRTRTDTNIGQ